MPCHSLALPCHSLALPWRNYYLWPMLTNFFPSFPLFLFPIRWSLWLLPWWMLLASGGSPKGLTYHPSPILRTSMTPWMKHWGGGNQGVRPSSAFPWYRGRRFHNQSSPDLLGQCSDLSGSKVPVPWLGFTKEGGFLSVDIATIAKRGTSLFKRHTPQLLARTRAGQEVGTRFFAGKV